jgi:hypothetical protein
MAAKAVAESMLRLLAGWAAPVGEAPVEVAGLKGRALTMVWKGLGPWKVLWETTLIWLCSTRGIHPDRSGALRIRT